MFKEILKIIPRLDNTDLNKMERTLTQRFGKIAKKFGKGLTTSLLGGGIAGIALGLIDKLLNPLKEVQESIDRVLHQGDDLVTNAKQFGTTPGRLAKLKSLGEATGLDSDSLNTLLVKFQGALAEAKADPTKQTSVRNFANDKDIAAAFFEFIKQLQKLEPDKQILVQQEVFGEKQILKMAEFLQADFDKLGQKFGDVSSQQLTDAANKLDEQEDLGNLLRAQREQKDLIKKSQLINSGITEQRAAAAQLDLDKENQRLASYQSLASISDGTAKIFSVVEQGFLKLTTLVDKVTGLNEAVKTFSPKNFFKYLQGGGK